MDNQDYIESYFTDEPNPDRTREFENRIESDSVFAEDVAFYLAALNVSWEASQLEKKKHFKEIYRKNPPVRTGTVRKLVYYIAAAAVVTGIVFGVYTFNKPVSPQQLASQYEMEHLKTLSVTMSSRTDSIQTGIRLYNDGKQAEALLQFEKIIQSDTSSYTAKKYAGIISLRMKDYEKAFGYFKQMESYTGMYSNPAHFYQALTLMERNQSGDATKAKQILQQIVQNDDEGKETAQEWLRKW